MTLTPVNGSIEGMENANGKKDEHKKLTGGDSRTPINNGFSEGGEKVNGKKDKHKQARSGK